MASELKPCPCGETPNRLLTSKSPSGRVGYASASCCTWWQVSFGAYGIDLWSDDFKEIAQIAWNSAPRKEG